MQKRSCKDRDCGLMRLAMALMLVALALLPLGATAQMTMTTVQGTVYRADGTPAGGTLLINWPAFTTAQNQAVAAGSLNTAISANGFVTVNLTPNAGALPSGSYYTATYHLNDGTVNQEYWVVPSSGTATVAAVRAQLQPSTVAVPQLASSTYVQNAIAGLSGTYLPLTGGTMTGALTLSGDPSGSTQAVTKHYVDQLAAQNLPLSGGSLTGALTAPTLYGKNIEGGLFADQWLSAGSNNGIAMSLQQCASLPYACQVLAPNLYAQVEAQPFGTAWGMMYPPQTTGPKASDPVAQFLDQRWGVPQYVFNGARTFDSRHGAWPSFVMNFIGSSSLTGTSTHPSGALNLATNWWTGGRNFYNDKMNAETLNVQENHYAQIQGGGSIGVEVSCFGNGDCLGAGITTVSYGGPNTGSDEANEGKDEKNIEGNAVFGARAASVSAAADGTTTLTTSSPVAAGTQGAGRLLIDLTKVYNSGYISSVGSTGIICATCNWDATFGTSTQTTLTAAVQNPVSGTNSFPQSNTTLTVASSAGFAVGDLAGIFDYDYECEKVTAVPDGTHITVATDQLPHPAGGSVLIWIGLAALCVSGWSPYQRAESSYSWASVRWPHVMFAESGLALISKGVEVLNVPVGAKMEHPHFHDAYVIPVERGMNLTLSIYQKSHVVNAVPRGQERSIENNGRWIVGDRRQSSEMAVRDHFVAALSTDEPSRGIPGVSNAPPKLRVISGVGLIALHRRSDDEPCAVCRHLRGRADLCCRRLNYSGYGNRQCRKSQNQVRVESQFFVVALWGGLAFLVGWGLLFISLCSARSRLWRWCLGGCGICGMIGGLGSILWAQWSTINQSESEDGQSYRLQHDTENVAQKPLTYAIFSYYSYSSEADMANVLNTDKQIAVIAALAEGSSIRSIERMTGIHRDTIMRLGVRVGQGCTRVMDATMRDLPCTRLEMDEIWGFVGKKEMHVRPGDDPQFGNVWTWCAIDADTKLVPAFHVGQRSRSDAVAFVKDVASRMKNRVQISTDGLRAYVDAMEEAFGADVDYGQIVKVYGREETDQRRYSPPEVISSEKIIVTGRPNVDLISTSYVERLNATTRLHMRRLTRLTHAFSKKRENFAAAVGLHFAYYNFVRRHNTLRCTPAMAAGVTRDFWSVGDLVEAAA